MKISKSTIRDVASNSAASAVGVNNRVLASNRDEAIEYIASAIQVLGLSVKSSNDPIEREAIANLSVVLFDLK